MRVARLRFMCFGAVVRLVCLAGARRSALVHELVNIDSEELLWGKWTKGWRSSDNIAKQK